MEVLKSDQILMNWAIAGQEAITAYAGLMGVVWRSTDVGELVIDTTLAVIYDACFSTSDTILWLVQH